MRKWRAIGCLVGLLLAATAGSGDALIAPLSDGARLVFPEAIHELPAPPEVLGYPLGTRFTHWSEIVAYLQRLAAASPRVSLDEYGHSWEGRPLLLLAISSPDNIARLAAVREAQQRLAGGAAPTESDPVVVWLGYGVHGNEPSSTEAAVATAYLLAAAGGEWPGRLARTVVLIDPLANPDGRERYVHVFEGRRGRAPDPPADAAEHREPWSDGRRNHYLVDLNRDWAWATQIETRGRLAAYRRWEPQVHVDFHETDTDPGQLRPLSDRPINVEIGGHQAKWVRRFDEAGTAAFERHGWTFRGGKLHDLHYPGYGDSYPSLRGAVGMTHETAGHGRAGEALQLAQGGLLTLADRIGRQLTASLATVTAAAESRQELLADFAAARRRAAGVSGRSYLWPSDQPEAAAAAELLARHGVEVGRLADLRTLVASPLAGGAARSRSFPVGTWTVSTRQPLGPLIRALMEADSQMPDEFLRRQRWLLERDRPPEFSDITAWSIPLACNLETWVVNRPITGAALAAERGALTRGGELGYLAAPQGLAGFRLTARLMAADLRFLVALQPFASGGRRYPAGSLFLPRIGNPGGLDERLAELAERLGVAVERTGGLLSPAGEPLRPEQLLPVRRPRVGLVGGAGVSASSYGAIWYLLDRQLELPHRRLEIASLGRVDLSRLDLLILPAGFGYAERLDRLTAAAIGSWVEKGGLLVAVGGAIAWLRQHGLTDVAVWRPDDETVDGAGRDAPASRRLHTPGAALATELAAEHPLTIGLRAPPPELFVGREILLATGDPRRDLLRAAADPVLAGFAWPEAAHRLAGALLVSIQPRGSGAVILFAQEPAFRLFWRAKLPLFLNTVMLGPSLNEAGRLTGP